MKNLDKKKLTIGAVAMVAVVAVVVVVVIAMGSGEKHLSEKTTNTFALEKIDDYSPDRKILLYADNQQINMEEISEIRLSDGTVLCRGEPFVANVFELENEDSITIVTKTNETFILTKK